MQWLDVTEGRGDQGEQARVAWAEHKVTVQVVGKALVIYRERRENGVESQQPGEVDGDVGQGNTIEDDGPEYPNVAGPKSGRIS